ncbi:hypothetical protein ACLMAJ_20225 [Nocardia sp. KC 131]|uniref:hypothetical protein n=1 Tax=Nocardia arseniciresistens TaxID=3392119 RepID=UPI00398EEBA6
MSEAQPTSHPAPLPGASNAYGPPQAREVSVAYRRWANILVWIGAVIAGLVVVALVASVVLLAHADADVDNAVYGYLAIYIWVGIIAAIPALLAVGIPGLVMKLRVRQQAQASSGL